MKSFVRRLKPSEGAGDVCGFELSSDGLNGDGSLKSSRLFNYVRDYRKLLQQRSLARGWGG